ncbi:hypothetical protein [Paraburkholderia aromaticivorans]|uniref:hypothetical protein n=1 Tax=Paraburkholderia aromaticivorans TaxID=2026199 RepID=UPI00145616A4|nr:hypothetical protein [Paraburkholderia aromaticivorans]
MRRFPYRDTTISLAYRYLPRQKPFVALEDLRLRLKDEKERAGIIVSAEPAQREQHGLVTRMALGLRNEGGEYRSLLTGILVKLHFTNLVETHNEWNEHRIKTGKAHETD